MRNFNNHIQNYMKIKVFPNTRNKNQDYNNFNGLPYSMVLIARNSIKKKYKAVNLKKGINSTLVNFRFMDNDVCWQLIFSFLFHH